MDFQSAISKTTDSLPLRKFVQQRQEKIFYERLELGETEDQEDNQFVFHGQCVVLGDSGVGKTSLVKSLTGKPFDPRQTKTQGVEQSLVDEKWNSFNMKELVFGDLWRFLSTALVQVILIGIGAANSGVVVQTFFVWKRGMRIMLCLLALPVITVSLFTIWGIIQSSCSVTEFSLHLMLTHFTYFILRLVPNFTFHFARNQFSRYTFATLSFILGGRGFIMGFYISLMMCYLDETYTEFATICAYLTPTAAIGTVVLFRLIGPISMSFGNHHQQLRLLANKLTIVTVCFFRLLFSILFGLIYGFAVASLGNFSLSTMFVMEENFTSPDPLVTHLRRVVDTPFVWHFPAEYCGLVMRSKFLSSIFEGSWESFVLLIVLIYYHFKLAWISRRFYFVILFPPLLFSTLYMELFCFHEVIPGNFEGPNKFITLVLGIAGMTDNKMLKSALDVKFSSLKLKIFDYAGDKEYYAYHHIFLRSDAIYIIVFNIVEFVKEDFSGITAGIQRLHFWFESVCSRVPRKAPIFLVGTHRGTINKNCMRILDGHLRRKLWDPYCDGLVVNGLDGFIFFPVENSEGKNDIGVQNLQKEIVSVAEQCKETIGRDLPLTWIRTQDAIISLQEEKEATFCVTLAEFPRAFDSFVCTSCSKETLKYFHEKGLVIYLDMRNENVDLSNWVLLKPEILVDIIIQLVTPPPVNTQQRGLRHDWNLLQKKGMLTKSLLKNIINKVQENEEAMTAFLEEYDLICPLLNKKVEIYSLYDQDEKQPNHFIPSLLPMSADGDLPVWHDDDDADKKLYVFFDRFLPQPLFHRLLSRAHKLSKVEFPNGQTVLYRDAGKFWMTRWQPYRLKLMKGQKMIEVTFRYR